VGRHYGKIIWSGYPSPVAKDYEWYRSTGTKVDGNSAHQPSSVELPYLREIGVSPKVSCLYVVDELFEHVCVK
jgi:hypothetical protein